MKLKYIFGMVAAVGLMNSCDVTEKSQSILLQTNRIGPRLAI